MTEKISPETSLKLIRKLGLKPSFARDLSLLGYSTVISSYEANLNDLVGFNYEAFGVLKNKETCCSMANPETLENNAEALLKDENRTKAMIKRAFDVYKEYSRKIEKIVNGGSYSPAQFKDLIEAYWHYSAGLGAYNIVYRAISDDSFSKRGISEKLVAEFAAERNIVGALFPKVEEYLKKICPHVDRELKIENATLLNLTYSESRKYFGDFKISRQLSAELKKRAEAWFFLNVFRKEEYVCSGDSEVADIYKGAFELIADKNEEIRGVGTFPGKVRGQVRILPLLNIPDEFEFKTGEILVSVHTNPDLMRFIKKSSAIITDEGGILSHAAIISRELKIPCVIGTKFATKVLKDGELVEVDAERGVIRKIEKR